IVEKLTTGHAGRPGLNAPLNNFPRSLWSGVLLSISYPIRKLCVRNPLLGAGRERFDADHRPLLSKENGELGSRLFRGLKLIPHRGGGKEKVNAKTRIPKLLQKRQGLGAQLFRRDDDKDIRGAIFRKPD